MENQKIFAVINPKAGHCDPITVKDLLNSYLNELEIDGEYVESSDISEIRESVKRAKADGYDAFMVAGGDGTVSAVAELLVNTDIDFGIIPVGTTNLVARALHIPEDDVAAAFRIAFRDYKSVALDVLELEGRYYFSNISAGISSFTMKKIDSKTKRFFGRLAYFLNGTILFFRHTEIDFRITLDDAKEKKIKASDVRINNFSPENTLFYNIFAESIPNDGVVECNIIAPRNFWDYLIAFFDVVFAIKRERRYIYRYRFKNEILILPEKDIPIQADGDPISAEHFHVNVVPKGINVRVPKANSKF
jgi:diacylglycerol kinase family enzyme